MSVKLVAPDMSHSCRQFLHWLIRGIRPAAFESLAQLHHTELFRALAIPAREDLRALFAAEMGDRTQFAPALPLLNYAFQVVMNSHRHFTKDASPPSPEALLLAKNFELSCVDKPAIPLNTTQDLTESLPAAASQPPTLSDKDFQSAAATLGVDVPAMKAVAQVESAGPGFGTDGRPKIRYELHYFERRTTRHFSATHPYLSQPNLASGKPYHDGTQKREYSLLYNAMLLTFMGERTIAQAIESTSWGKFQVMGANWSALGWSSALQFASDMYVSEANHLKAFVKFVQKHNLTNALKNHNWASFAQGYNGTGYKDNNYDVNLDKYYKQFSAAAATPGHT